MVMINIVYEGELRCRAVHTPSGTEMITDAPLDNHGKAESFSPTDLVATALGTCILTTMGIVADRLSVSINGARIRVEKEMAAAPSRRIGALKTLVNVPSVGINDEQKKKLEHAGLNCPVHKSLHPGIAAPIEFIWE